MEGGHYNAASRAKKVLLNCLTIIGSREHFGHFMLDFLWPCYHWLYVHGRLYDDDLTIYTLDRQVEKFRSILDEFFRCHVKTDFFLSEIDGCYTDMILGMEGHNRKVFKLAVRDYIGDPIVYSKHMREYAFDKLRIDVRTPTKLLLIERKMTEEDRGGGRRNISNPRELEAALSVWSEMRDLDFENIVLEDMTFIEQVQAFSEARIVVGQHGAGFCHFLWMQPGGLLQELHQNANETYRFREFCRSFGLRHSHMSCPRNGKSIEVPVRDLIPELEKQWETK